MVRKTRKSRIQTLSKKKGAMRFFGHNPVFIAIISTVIGGILVGIALFYLFEYRAERRAKTALMADINNADELLEANMTDDALAIYQNTLKTVSVRKYPEIYAHIKHNEGICYYELANVRDKEQNLTRAIRAYEEALKIRTVEKYPLDYATAQSNLGLAYCNLAEVRDKEENLTRAIRAYEEALKIYTVEKYPLYYEIMMSNMGKAKQKLQSNP
ncbi:hypothetical protein CEE35_04595 [Candidatus Aerophobetes bacterium Ae_b3b]|nr:MAG: hypothetical protein CEE35_04595 [Candidatus Aerophobetes bacterium Ae_b3b]